MRKISLSVILWRLFFFLPLFFIRYIPVPTDNRYLGIYPWANFDGDHYLAIAMHGYDASVARFLPFYPLLIKFFSPSFSKIPNPEYVFVIGLLISNFAFLIACLIMYKLLRIDYREKISFLSVFFLILFPSSFFFVSIYSESVFLLLTVLTLYFARKKKWLFAVIVASFLPVTRPIGIAILPALCVEWVLQQKEKNRPSLRTLISFVTIPIGLIGYAIFNFFKWGNLFYFAQAHAELSNGRSTGIVLIPQTLFRYWKMITTVPFNQHIWQVALLELVVFIFAAVLLYIGYIKKVRASYLIFALISFLIPTSSGTFTGLPRYVLVLFPIFLALALIKNARVKIMYVVVSIILSVILLMLFARGYYIA